MNFVTYRLRSPRLGHSFPACSPLSRSVNAIQIKRAGKYACCPRLLGVIQISMSFRNVSRLTYNFTNQSTQYQNGVDMHFDWGASQFLTKQFLSVLYNNQMLRAFASLRSESRSLNVPPRHASTISTLCTRFESKPKSSTEKISRREFLAAHIEALVLRTGLLERGHRGGRLGHLSATQCAAELTRRTSREVREVPILLQKSFCTGDQKFSGLWTRLLCKDVGDLMA